MTIKVFKDLGLFIAMRHIYSWQHQSTFRVWTTSNRLLMEFATCFTRICFFLECLKVCYVCIPSGHAGPMENECWTCLKVRWSFRVPASWKNLPDILLDTEESDWQTANTGRNVFGISSFMEKSAGYYGAVGWRWILQWYRRTVGNSPGSETSLSFLEFWKLPTMYFLFT